MILEIRDLTVAYGLVVAVQGVSLQVEAGTIAAVIGANGAGKTSLLRGVMGQIRPRGGQVIYEGRAVTGSAPHKIVRQGMTVVPQDRGTLAPLTVADNLAVAGNHLSKTERVSRCGAVYELFPVLHERRAVKAGLLSGGEQQMLAFGRALVTKPKLLLLDEPSTGLSPLMTTTVMRSIKTLCREQNITILVVEQNVAAVLLIADYGYVLDRGRLVHEGDAAALRDDQEVRTAFIGM